MTVSHRKSKPVAQAEESKGECCEIGSVESSQQRPSSTFLPLFPLHRDLPLPSTARVILFYQTRSDIFTSTSLQFQRDLIPFPYSILLQWAQLDLSSTTVAEPGTRYHCDVCAADITLTVRIRCAEGCEDFDLCGSCFCNGAELGKHKASHAYRVVVSDKRRWLNLAGMGSGMLGSKAIMIHMTRQRTGN